VTVRGASTAAGDDMQRQMPSEPGSLPASLTLAGRYRRDGRLADAEEIRCGVLAAQPDSYEALRLVLDA
jgi:hypothetical protein